MSIFDPYKGLPREVYVIFFSRMINAAGTFVHPLLTLLLVAKIGMTDAAAGSVVAITGLLFAPASVLGGKLADIVGRKKLIVIFDSLGSLSLLVCSFLEPSMTMVYMIIAGSFMWGMAAPAHDALISDITTPENRTGAFSLSYLGFNLGFVIGPIVGGLLFERYFALFFILDAATGLIASLLILLLVKETIHLSKAEMSPDRAQERQMEGSIFRVLMRRPTLLVFAVLMFGYSFVYSQWGFLIPIHIQDIRPEGFAVIFGRLASLNGLVVILFTPILTSVFRRWGNLDRIVLGGILYTLGFGILGFFSELWVFALTVVVFTLGEIIIHISFMPYVANHTPGSHRGRMSSVLSLVSGMGHSVGPLVMGMVSYSMGIPYAWKMVGVVMLVTSGLIAVLDLYERRRDSVAEQLKKSLA